MPLVLTAACVLLFPRQLFEQLDEPQRLPIAERMIALLSRHQRRTVLNRALRTLGARFTARLAAAACSVAYTQPAPQAATSCARPLRWRCAA